MIFATTRRYNCLNIVVPCVSYKIQTNRKCRKCFAHIFVSVNNRERWLHYSLRLHGVYIDRDVRTGRREGRRRTQTTKTGCCRRSGTWRHNEGSSEEVVDGVQLVFSANNLSEDLKSFFVDGWSWYASRGYDRDMITIWPRYNRDMTAGDRSGDGSGARTARPRWSLHRRTDRHAGVRQQRDGDGGKHRQGWLASYRCVYTRVRFKFPD